MQVANVREKQGVGGLAPARSGKTMIADRTPIEARVDPKADPSWRR